MNAISDAAMTSTPPGVPSFLLPKAAVGRQMAERLVASACGAGYKVMWLETTTFMQERMSRRVVSGARSLANEWRAQRRRNHLESYHSDGFRESELRWLARLFS
jgi:hypothetical protein